MRGAGFAPARRNESTALDAGARRRSVAAFEVRKSAKPLPRARKLTRGSVCPSLTSKAIGEASRASRAGRRIGRRKPKDGRVMLDGTTRTTAKAAMSVTARQRCLSWIRDTFPRVPQPLGDLTAVFRLVVPRSGADPVLIFMKPSVWFVSAQKFPMFGNTDVRSLGDRPYQYASVSAY